MKDQPIRRVMVNLGITLACLGLAACVEALVFQRTLGPQNAILWFVLAVFLIAVLTDGHAYCLTAAVASVLIFDHTITAQHPGQSFAADFPVTLLIMVLISLVASSVTARIKLRETRAREKERLSDLLYQINERLLSAHGIQSIADEANRYIAQQLGRSSCVYPRSVTAGPAASGELRFVNALPEDEAAEAFALPEVQAAAGLWVGRLMRDNEGPVEVVVPPMTLFPLVMERQLIGILAISRLKGILDETARHFVSLLAKQAAQALHVEGLRQQRQQAVIAAETEQSRNKFLRAISHDLRTPLTGILSASSAMMESEGGLQPEVNRKLARDIHDDASWLLNMVQNILFTTRMQAKGVRVSKKEEALEEVVANAVAGIRKRFPECRVEIAVPDHLIMAPMDGLLIAQVITNLLENAIRHNPNNTPEIRVTLEEREAVASVSVADNGPGLPSEILSILFEPKAVTNAAWVDVGRGFGMGLSICKAIVKAHQGVLEGANRPEGGAVFRLDLPMGREKA